MNLGETCEGARTHDSPSGFRKARELNNFRLVPVQGNSRFFVWKGRIIPGKWLTSVYVAREEEEPELQAIQVLPTPPAVSR